jgi:hypothetical protein
MRAPGRSPHPDVLATSVVQALPHYTVTITQEDFQHFIQRRPDLTFLLIPKVNTGLPSSSIVTLGARLPKNLFAASSTFTHATAFKGGFHITLFALRNLRNTQPTRPVNQIRVWVT